jgi:hypothetical protein
MTTPALPGVVTYFGSALARPRVAFVYRPAEGGYVPLEGRPRLTAELARQLLEDGVGMVELAWLGRHRRMSLFEGSRHSVWGPPPGHPSLPWTDLVE